MNQFKEMGRQLILLVSFLREKDIVWGDMKPENLMVFGAYNNVKAIDFDTARDMAKVDDRSCENMQ